MFITPEQFGAKGDGVTDDAVALQEFFDATEINPFAMMGNKEYCTSQPLKWGNGSDAKRSTINNCTIFAAGSLCHSVAMFNPFSPIVQSGTRIKYIGSGGSGTYVFEIAGPIHGLNLIGGISVNANDIADEAIRVISTSFSKFDGLAGYNAKVCNNVHDVRHVTEIDGEANAIGTHENYFGLIVGASPNIPGAQMLSWDGYRVAGGQDVTHNTYNSLAFQFNLDGGVGLRMGFSDFNRVGKIVATGFGEEASNDAAGIWADGGSVPFNAPDLNFFGQVAVGHHVGLRSTGSVGENIIEHYSMNDQSIYPNANGFSGRVYNALNSDVDGQLFGKYGNLKIPVHGDDQGIVFYAGLGSPVRIAGMTRQSNDFNIDTFGLLKREQNTFGVDPTTNGDELEVKL